jgi:hypothetical protein
MRKIHFCFFIKSVRRKILRFDRMDENKIYFFFKEKINLNFFVEFFKFSKKI